jgi:hypothetical protein
MRTTVLSEAALQLLKDRLLCTGKSLVKLKILMGMQYLTVKIIKIKCIKGKIFKILPAEEMGGP